MTEKQAKQKGLKKFVGDGYVVLAHPKSCFFCPNCTDIVYDFLNGPYMFFCGKYQDIDKGLSGKCTFFEEESASKEE